MSAFRLALFALGLYIAALASALSTAVSEHTATALGYAARGANRIAVFCDAQRARLEAKAVA